MVDHEEIDKKSAARSAKRKADREKKAFKDRQRSRIIKSVFWLTTIVAVLFVAMFNWKEVMGMLKQIGT
ncbi:MAG: hypothetical protein HOB79_13915 [Rhodospirillaceae bacterium]|jgi:cell division protein FtsL|nr:hypothetical protein [Rhodospirillaceae bacterium]MBT7484724.1 hypothetical protein [Rhodospirillales bacterium]MBT4702162.1 hypothetical protein [Rhodospirillaceae bacterium]MBT5035368.1 hypothetical protein [Rhodospirillaceae bacterium]MBT6220058.1 hypothetical protein [Rhodospirillaceae bacterium]